MFTPGTDQDKDKEDSAGKPTGLDSMAEITAALCVVAASHSHHVVVDLGDDPELVKIAEDNKDIQRGKVAATGGSVRPAAPTPVAVSSGLDRVVRRGKRESRKSAEARVRRAIQVMGTNAKPGLTPLSPSKFG